MSRHGDETIPRYQWVYNSLKSRIEVEDFKVGDFLPPEPELQRLFNVSRTTVRRAVEMLAQQGFVYIRQGRGTEMLDFKATQKLRYVTSFSETLREQGFAVRTRTCGWTCPRPAPRRRSLGVASGLPLVQDRAGDPGQRQADRHHDQLPAAGARARHRAAHRAA